MKLSVDNTQNYTMTITGRPVSRFVDSNKPKIKYIPRRGLRWTDCYATSGDIIWCYPFFGDGFAAKVIKPYRNKYGRISYKILPIGKKHTVMTEELTPLHHKGVRP